MTGADIDAALTRLIDENGALLVMPGRHQLVLLPLHSASDAVRGPATLLLWAHADFNDGPGPVSERLFWWRDGRLTALDGAVVDRSVHFTPNEDYLALATQLAEAAHPGDTDPGGTLS